MRLSTATVGMLLGLALVLSSCAEDDSTAANRPVEGANAAGSSASTSATGGAVTALSRCQRQLGDFIAAMADLRDRLARGLSYEEYLREVGAIRSAYARIRADQVPAGCLIASGGPSERAFNHYIDAANEWGGCLATPACETRSIEPKLQSLWALAAHQLSAAQRPLTQG